MQELDRMEGTFEVGEVAPAEFTLSGLRFLSDTIQAGGVLTTYVIVTNTGGEAGAFTARMTGALAQNRTSQVLNPGQGEELMFYQAVDLPGSPAGIAYNIEIDGGAVNGPLTGSFTVTAVAAPKGHILGIMVKKAGGDWQQLGVERLILNETIQLSVSWANDSYTLGLKGHIALRILKPNLQEWTPTPVSGQDTIVVPGGSSYVLYEIPLDQKGTWRHYEVLTGAIP